MQPVKSLYQIIIISSLNNLMIFSFSKLYFGLTYRISIFLLKLKLINYKLKFGDKVNFEKDVHIGKHTLIYMGPGSKLFKISKSTQIRDFCTFRIEGTGKLIIGENSFINSYCSIGCLGEIIIGNNTMFGEGVRVYDTNHNYKTEALISEQGYQIKQVRIGNNCWIGSNTIILAGVEIGDNVVIGANCTIYKNIPSNTLIKSLSGYKESILYYKTKSQ